MSGKNIRLDASWLAQLENEFSQEYMLELKAFLLKRRQQQTIIYPSGSHIFNALNSTPFEKVKVVILGQDPYHGPGQAHGLCFSVPKGVRPPPSLVNIFKELNADLNLPIPPHGCLQAWAAQGVLLLNSVLTVEHKMAGSHAGKGWEQFTDSVIAAINAKREAVVFLLWGSYAHKKGQLIDPERHCILKSVHPSPLSAHRGFLGCRHFSQANQYLQSKGLDPVDWRLDFSGANQ